MTPEEAQALETGTTPGPWHALHEEWDDEDGTPCERFCVIAGGDAILETIDFDPRYHDPKANVALAAAAPDMRATIAALEWEYRAEVRADQNSQWHPVTRWSTEWPLRCGVTVGDRERIVRRRVGPVEVVDMEGSDR